MTHIFDLTTTPRARAFDTVTNTEDVVGFRARPPTTARAGHIQSYPSGSESGRGWCAVRTPFGDAVAEFVYFNGVTEIRPVTDNRDLARSWAHTRGLPVITRVGHSRAMLELCVERGIAPPNDHRPLSPIPYGDVACRAEEVRLLWSDEAES